MNSLTDLEEWQALRQHHAEIANQHMRDWFLHDPKRFSQYTLQQGEIFVDYSRNRITNVTRLKLCQLAKRVGLAEKIEQLFSGQLINFTEKRAALHSALRDKNHTEIIVGGENIAPHILKAKNAMRDFVQQIHSHAFKGITGKPIMHIVNVGIGGSHLGPMMCTNALKDFAVSNLQFHFISSIDQAKLDEVLKAIDPETTLFIISSKTFTTIETLTNAQTISLWLKESLGAKALSHHFFAITAKADKAMAFGINKTHIFPVWDWVGGRYSIWSAIGLPLMLCLGPAQYEEFLMGGFEMDEHFRHADFKQNIPVMLALIGIWYMNFFGANTQAIIPYSYRLRHFIAYLQQAEMESNGKSIDREGRPLTYTSGPVIFGQEGCDGQHAYHQLLMQGQHLIPADFIMLGQPHAPQPYSAASTHSHHTVLFASGLSQAQALMRGKTVKEAYDELIKLQYSPQDAAMMAPHRVIPGNCPSNVIFIKRLTPKNLGALIALYEHKIFVQGVIWNINSFDQWGVELGKQLLPDILRDVQGKKPLQQYDCATAGLIEYFKKMQCD